MDLGVSSPQSDDRRRGFNVFEDVLLDLRMNPHVGIPAWQWLKQVSVEELTWVIHAYGEDEDRLLAERIAHALVQAAADAGGRPLTCKGVADLVKRVVEPAGNFARMHPAKLTVQAIRVHLNQEMQQLDRTLIGSFRALEMNGQCSVISF